MSTRPERRKSTSRDLRRALATAVLALAGAVAGLVIAIIVTLNLHIFLGVEDGYMATPTQVLERSAWILVADAVILVAAPLLAVILVFRLRRAPPEPDRGMSPSSDRESQPRRDDTTG
ncbi:MAG: hypothetical protein ACQERF_11875 [Actinomycetota bacterium]